MSPLADSVTVTGATTVVVTKDLRVTTIPTTKHTKPSRVSKYSSKKGFSCAVSQSVLCVLFCYYYYHHRCDADHSSFGGGKPSKYIFVISKFGCILWFDNSYISQEEEYKIQNCSLVIIVIRLSQVLWCRFHSSVGEMLDNMPRIGGNNSNGGGVMDSNEDDKRVYKLVLTGGEYSLYFF